MAENTSMKSMSSASALKVTAMPAGHGDCVLVQCDDFNVMVDSGPRNATIHQRVRAALVTALDGQPIHLAIVTHHDDDHIGGLERMLDQSTPTVKDLLFNSPRRIREYLEAHSSEEVNASTRQALHVAEKRTPCNDKAIVAGEQYAFFDGRIKLKILSPTCKDVLRYGPRMLAAISEEELAGSRGRDTPVCGKIHELLAMQDDDKAADMSETNALSLAFILTFEKRSILFLGDSLASRVTASLAGLHTKEPRVPLNLVFVSHHGSKNNNTAELYRHIGTSTYVISADGKQNPDIETFARILRAVRPVQPEFHFPEETPQLKQMFSNSDLNVHLPNPGPLTFNL